MTQGNGRPSAGGPRLGSWARSGGLVGLVARTGEGRVTLFDPSARRMAEVAAGDAEAVPSAAVTVTATVDLPMAHGLDEEDVRRWLAALADPALRERARAALAEAGLDEGAALPSVRVDVRPMAASGAVCLCGAKVPAPPGAALACPACGREAAAAPAT